jgi:hypothetical protein
MARPRRPEQGTAHRDTVAHEAVTVMSPAGRPIRESTMRAFRQAWMMAVAVAIMMTAGPGGVGAQNFGTSALGAQYFRVDTEPATTTRGRIVLRGYVYNLSPFDVGNVRLSVESLDASGQPVGTATTGWVNGDIQINGRRYFEVPVRTAAPVYRVSVESFEVRFSDLNG